MDFENDNAIWESGIMQNANTKQDSCKTINYMVGNNNIQINHSVTIDEGLSFGLNKKGKYQGLGKNDDCFMTVLNMVNYHKTEDFEEQVNDIYDNTPDNIKLIIENMLGISDDNNDSDDIY